MADPSSPSSSESKRALVVVGGTSMVASPPLPLLPPAGGALVVDKDAPTNKRPFRSRSYRERGAAESARLREYYTAKRIVDKEVPIFVLAAERIVEATEAGESSAAIAGLISVIASSGAADPGPRAAAIVAAIKSMRRIETVATKVQEEATIAAIIEDKPRVLRPLKSLVEDMRATRFWMKDTRTGIKSSLQLAAIQEAQRAIAGGTDSVTHEQKQYAKVTGYFMHSDTTGGPVKLAQRFRLDYDIKPIEWYYEYYYEACTPAVMIKLFDQVKPKTTTTVDVLPTDKIDASTVHVAV